MSRTGKARGAKFVELFFDALLLICFIAQAFLLGCLVIYGYLPLPTNWISQKITKQLPEGISVQAESYKLSLDGTIFIENFSLKLEGIEQPIFSTDYAHTEFKIASAHGPFINLEEIVVSEGRFILPAVYSPDGKDSSILEQIALRLLPSREGLKIDSFAALHENIRLRGSIDWALDESMDEAVDVRKSADQLFKQIATALKQKQRLQGLTQPTILFSIDAGTKRPFNLDCRISSRLFEQPDAKAENLTVDAVLSLADQTLVSKSSLLLEAGSIELPSYNIRAADVVALIERDDWQALLKGEWPDMEILAKKLNIEKVGLRSPRISLRPQDFPNVAFQGFTSGLKGAVEFSGRVDTNSRTARVAAHGSLDLLSLVPEDVMSKLPAVIMNEAPYYNLSVEFDEGFALRNASLRARVDELEVAELKFDHIRLRGNYTEGVYSIDNLYLRRDWQWLNLGFGLDSSTKNYFLSLKGFAKPYDYNAILPRWWGGIFKDFDFEQIESGLGDFVIYGNTGNKAADFFFGHAKGSRVGYKGVLVDEGELFVRGRGAYAEVHKLNVRRGEGYARGDIRFASRLDNVRGPMSVRMDLDTKLPLSDAKKLFDQNIAKILDDFESDAMPRTVLRGAIYNSAYPEFDGLSYIDLTATCPFPLSYKGIPLKYLGFNLAGRTDITYLRDIRFGFAGGEAEAQADILTNGEDPAEVRFMASLKGANQEQTMGYLTTQGKKVEKVKQPEEDSPVSSTGRIDIMLHAKCPVQDFMKIAGSGDLQIENDKLYAIQLFGPLSRLLQNTRLGFTSFALNQLDAGFTIKDGTADINRLVINGPRTKIEAPGTVTLDNLSLDMRVSVYLFGNSGNPDSNIRKIGNLITKPIPNLLEFELTGYPEDQKWRSLYDPRKLIPRF